MKIKEASASMHILSFRKRTEKPSTGGTPCLLRTIRQESPGGKDACECHTHAVQAAP